jgi:hypothetical protein
MKLRRTGRYQDWIDAEAAAAEYAEWQDRMTRETGGLTGDECEEIASRSETTSARIRRVERHRALVNGLREMLASRTIYGGVACDRIKTLLKGEGDGSTKT